MNDFSFYKKELRKYNKILVKGNPRHSSYANGFSIFNINGELELTELNWNQVVSLLNTYHEGIRVLQIT